MTNAALGNKNIVFNSTYSTTVAQSFDSGVYFYFVSGYSFGFTTPNNNINLNYYDTDWDGYYRVSWPLENSYSGRCSSYTG